jgi:large subunit ribosomal protein L17
MKHGMYGRKLGRKTNHRRALFRNLAAALFQHGQITTTLPKAKAVQPFVEKLVTLARKGDLASRRRAVALLNDRYLVTVDKETGDPVYEQRDSGTDRKLIQKLFEDIGPSFSDREGGYTRIIKLAKHRIGDGADLVVLQLVGDEEGPSMSGRISRRRQKQDNRTAFAAKLRKQQQGDSEAESETATAVAEEEAPADEATQTAEAPEQTEASTEAKNETQAESQTEESSGDEETKKD